MKSLLLILGLLGGMAGGQDSPSALRQSIDAALAPRSLLLSGGDLDSLSGSYVIEFPAPNDCLSLGPIKAKSRAFALYSAVSQGGFTLKPAEGGLTVWTIEEWNALKTESWYPAFAAAHDKKCSHKVEAASPSPK